MNLIKEVIVVEGRDVYKLHCSSDTYHVILVDDSITEVQILKQNKDLTYEISY